MQRAIESAKPDYIINKKGDKKAVILSLKEYTALIELIEDLEDTNDLLRAERNATAFIPYDKFRKTWVKD